MAGIIKGGIGFGYVPVVPSDEAPVMRTVYGAPPEEEYGTRTVYGTPEAYHESEAYDAPTMYDEPFPESEAEFSDILPEAEESDEAESKLHQNETQEEEAEEPDSIERVSPEEAALERSLLIEEYEQLREQYERESELFIQRAREKAAEIYEKTKESAKQTIEQARAEGDRIKAEARVEGKKLGYDEGYTQGHDEGYVSALKKCKDTLLELKSASEAVTAQKEQIFLEYEHALFDTIFEIAQKITIGSLKQKDKAVITKMLRAAGKRYRSSKTVKITLSQLDISEEAEIDEALLKEIFRDDALIEIEIVKDAPQGTLLIDSGSEITDAGVSTQLKMIEQLGKRKYRDKALTDLLQAKRDKEDGEES